MAPAHRTDLLPRRELSRLGLHGEDTVRTARTMIMTLEGHQRDDAAHTHGTGAHSL